MDVRRTASGVVERKAVNVKDESLTERRSRCGQLDRIGQAPSNSTGRPRQELPRMWMKQATTVSADPEDHLGGRGLAEVNVDRERFASQMCPPARTCPSAFYRAARIAWRPASRSRPRHKRQPSKPPQA